MKKIEKEQLGDYIKRTLHIAWPSVLESFFMAVMNIMDTYMVSAVGSAAVAAVGLTLQPRLLTWAVFMAMNVAVSALVARRRGENDREDANRVMLMALLFSVIAAAFIAIVCVSFARQILQLCGAQQDTLGMAASYFKITMVGLFFMAVSWMINAAQRGSGKTKISMITNITSNVVNIILNYLLITGHMGFPAWGVKGAAAATVIGNGCAALLSILSLFSRDNFLSIFYIIKKKIRPTLEPVSIMVKLGGSVFLEQILMRIGFMLTAVMAAKLGTNDFAAHQVCMNILTFSFAFGDGMQVAAVALIGQSLGQKEPERAKIYGMLCRKIGLIMSIILGIIYIVFGRLIFQQFFEEQSIVDTGVSVIPVIIFTILFQICQVIYNGCLRGAGDVVYVTVTCTISATFIRTIVSYLGGYVLGLGLIGIWFGIFADQFSRAVFSTIRFRQGKWTQIHI